jgi:hypothetical protein
MRTGNIAEVGHSEVTLCKQWELPDGDVKVRNFVMTHGDFNSFAFPPLYSG